MEASLEMTAKLPVISKELENRIIISSLSELRAGLDNGEFSCEELLTCYLHRLRNLNREYRLINEIQYEDAILQARILDTELKSGQKRGFFHGIPISVKDMISIKKFTATVGLTKNAFNVQTEDSLVISALRAQGAIFFITGAVPQNTGSYETVNYKTGRALNPFNKQRTPGGSSGGDAGIVALGCASLSIGTDLYGSIRIPASFCGLYGIRPTSNRVSLKGPREFFQPYPCLSSGIGPMAKFADDCAEFMKALCNEHVFSQDANIPPLL